MRTHPHDHSMKVRFHHVKDVLFEFLRMDQRRLIFPSQRSWKNIRITWETPSARYVFLVALISFETTPHLSIGWAWGQWTFCPTRRITLRKRCTTAWDPQTLVIPRDPSWSLVYAAWASNDNSFFLWQGRHTHTQAWRATAFGRRSLGSTMPCPTVTGVDVKLQAIPRIKWTSSLSFSKNSREIASFVLISIFCSISSIIIYHHLSSSIIIYHHLSLSFIIYHNLL